MQSSLQMVQNGCISPASPSPVHVDAVDGKGQAVISVEAAAAAVEALVKTDQQQQALEHTEEAQQQRGSARAMPAKAPKKHSRRRNGVHPLVPNQGAELQENLEAVETEVAFYSPVEQSVEQPVEQPVDQPVEGDTEEEVLNEKEDSVVKAVLDPFKFEDKADVKIEDDQKCRSCWATFPSVNELGIHIKKQHVVNRVCHRCGITKFDTYFDFEEHHLAHLKGVDVTVKLEVLDSSKLPPLPPPRRAVARKRTARAITPPPVREPIKLTLRLTTGRQAKAAEERHEAARRAEMLTAIEAASNNALSKPEQSTKEEALFQKAITELNSPVPCDSPAPSFVLRYSPSPPASTASTDQQSSSQPSSRPPSVGSSISVRPPEALLAPASSADDDSLLRTMLDKIGSPQQNAHEPEFVSLDRLANSVSMTLAATVPLSNSNSSFLNTTAPSYQPMHLQNLAAMQPNPILLPNLLMTNSLPSRPADPLSMSPHLSPQMNNSINFSPPNNIVPTSASSPQNISYSCGVCGSRWPNLTALEAHCSVARHYRCAVCHLNFSDLPSLNVHRQAAHGPSPTIPYLQPQPRNPPPLYRGTVMTTQQQYQTGPPPLVYQQAQIRGAPSFIRQFGPRPDQFRAAAPQRQAYSQNMRQTAPQQQHPQPRNIAPQPRHASPVLQNTPTKRPAPLLNSASPPVKKRPEIPARQPEDCQIIAMQQSGDGVPQIQSVQGSATVIPGSDKGNASIVKLTSEITLSVKPKPDQQKKNNVASLLANRGITVTTSNKNKNNESVTNHTPPPAPPPAIPESLSMNSSISILPASRSHSNSQSSSQQQQSSPSNFAVPRPRPIPVNNVVTANPERPPRPPTVDLTTEAAIQAASRTSPTAGRRTLNCGVCQRPMPSPLALQQHMQVHHPQQAAQQQQQAAQNKLPYRCTLCSASYPTVQGLHNHRQVVHKEPAPPPPPTPGDMGIPVVDLRSPGTVERLTRLGIHHYIPLPAQNGSNYFSIPIVSADLARSNPGSLFSLQAMNASSVMPFGPLRALPR